MHRDLDLEITDSFFELGIRLLQALGAAAIFLALMYVILPETMIERGIFALSVGLVMVLIVSWRFLYSLVLEHGVFNQKIIAFFEIQISVHSLFSLLQEGLISTIRGNFAK